MTSLPPSSLPLPTLSTAPSISSYPQAPTPPPSLSPTTLLPSNVPSLSILPTITSAPSFVPSTSPTNLPVENPSAAPSQQQIIASEETYVQELYVNMPRYMSEGELFLYESNYESYTGEIGINVTGPFIKTNCTVMRQWIGSSGRFLEIQLNYHSSWTADDLNGEPSLLRGSSSPGIERKTQEEPNYYLLLVQFSMNYTTKYGIEDINNYPMYFFDFVSDNSTRTTEDLQALFFDGSFLQSVGKLYYAVDAYWPETTTLDTESPTPVLTMSPSDSPSLQPSVSPSKIIVVENVETSKGRRSVVVGVCTSLGVLGAVGIVAIFYRMTKRKKSQNAQQVFLEEQTPDAKSNIDDSNSNEKQVLETAQVAETGVRVNELKSTQNKHPLVDQKSSIITKSDREVSSEMALPESTKETYVSATIDSMFTVTSDAVAETNHQELKNSKSQEDLPQTSDVFLGANLMEDHDGLSSESDDGMIFTEETKTVITDDFDKHKNNSLESMRTELEETIANVEGMMSMAITQILMMTEDSGLDMSWVGAQDLGSIEASCYSETNQWIIENKQAMAETAHHFFEDMLNRMAAVVFHGIIHPEDGVRLLHSCASMLGLTLLKELPNTIVLVQGLRESNDLVQGHQILVDTFNPFGSIIDAAISPKNKEFGFVHFVKPESVGAVVRKYRSCEIEIQDKSVIVVPLKRK